MQLRLIVAMKNVCMAKFLLPPFNMTTPLLWQHEHDNNVTNWYASSNNKSWINNIVTPSDSCPPLRITKKKNLDIWNRGRLAKRKKNIARKQKEKAGSNNQEGIGCKAEEVWTRSPCWGEGCGWTCRGALLRPQRAPRFSEMHVLTNLLACVTWWTMVAQKRRFGS